MVLTADIGNSNISVGVYSLNGALQISFTLACDRKKSADEFAVHLKNLFDLNRFDLSWITGSIIGSVVPDLTDIVGRAIMKLTATAPMVLGPGMKTSLDIKTDRPGEVGADIVANAVAGLNQLEPPMVIVDFGTATTVIGINFSKQLTDVFILPGVRSSLNALIRDAAEIPSVPLSGLKNGSGKNTADSVNVGLVCGHAFAVDGFIDWFRKLYGVSCISAAATGGSAELILPCCRQKIQYCPNLTTDGLFRIFLKNCTN